jgi:hypothetical protein
MCMSVSLSVPIGIGLILLGIGGRAAIEHCMSTESWIQSTFPYLVHRDTSAPGRSRLNLHANYSVYLAPGTDWRWEGHGPRMITPGLGYCLKTSGGPPVRFALRSTVTSTLSPMWTKGMPLFIP